MKKNHILTAALIFSVFELSTAQINILHNFDGTYGRYPTGSLTLVGSKLFGMTPEGGAANYGTIFSVDTGGGGFTDLYDFTVGIGVKPYGSLFLSGNKLYGITSEGGARNNGSLFSINTTGSEFKVLYNFDSASGGSNPTLMISGNKIYGTNGLGTNGLGDVYSIDTDGTNYIDLMDFNISGPNHPSDGLIISGNLLFGMLSQGGANSVGCVFSIHTDGTAFKDLFDFNISNGEHPMADLILSGNQLFGMTPYGAGAGYGDLFTVDTNGGGFSDLLDFDVANFGASPNGSLALSLNTLFGMTSAGGGGDSGRVFSINTNGGGYKNIMDVNSITGSQPIGNLTLTNNAIYGMIQYGGAYSGGLIFSIKDKTLGIGNLPTSQNTISIYPNPSQGIFTFSFSNTNIVSASQTILEVYNEMGQTILTQILRSAQDDKVIDLTGRPNGVYFYRVLNEGGSVLGSGKVIIQK